MRPAAPSRNAGSAAGRIHQACLPERQAGSGTGRRGHGSGAFGHRAQRKSRIGAAWRRAQPPYRSDRGQAHRPCVGAVRRYGLPRGDGGGGPFRLRSRDNRAACGARCAHSLRKGRKDTPRGREGGHFGQPERRKIEPAECAYRHGQGHSHRYCRHDPRCAGGKDRPIGLSHTARGYRRTAFDR